jgi:hypothetical protein
LSVGQPLGIKGWLVNALKAGQWRRGADAPNARLGEISLSAKHAGRAVQISLAAILLIAATVRLHNIDFGLPSLWDDDEPFFLMFGLKLLKSQTLNPGWFGHPGTTTIYLIALCTSMIYGAGALVGEWSGTQQFISAIYANPALIMVPQRVMIVIPALVSVWLTYLIGRRIHSAFAGLVAAAILALSPLHIDLSQLIRTDVQLTMCILLSVYFALPLADTYRRSALIGSSIMAGIACATKWPGMLILLVPIGLLLSEPGSWTDKARRIALAIGTAIAALLIVSPYILIDYQTVLTNILVEGRPRHLSQTSGGFFQTLSYYLLQVIPGALGWPVLALCVAGLMLALTGRWNRQQVIPIAVPILTFLAVISLQSIMWPRWALPLLPFLAMAAALVVGDLKLRVMRFGKPVAAAILVSVVTVLVTPLAIGALHGSMERSNDTRDQAISWISKHAPAGSSVAVETPAIALLKGPWSLRFPLGKLGCIDPRKAMASQVDYDDVASATKGRININLSTVPQNKSSTCRADYIIVNELDRYLAEARYYPNELANYRSLLVEMRQVAIFVPKKGMSGGPIVRIYARQRKTD